jgi:uncharacterized protein
MKIPKPRVPNLAFGRVGRRWLANDVAATQLTNAVNLLFPAGERFFIRSVRRYQDRLPADLRARVRGFFGQEGRHAQAHERFFDTLRAQGLPVDALLERYEYLAYGVIERFAPPLLCLSVTVALEHFTAILAENALCDSSPVTVAEKEMRQLLEWHAVEELEHKSVAFDVLEEVAPSYALRMVGLAFATATLGGFWFWLARELWAAHGITTFDGLRALHALRSKATASGRRIDPVILRVFSQGIRAYVRPGFHPDDIDHRELVERTLARLRAEGVIAAAA